MFEFKSHFDNMAAEKSDKNKAFVAENCLHLHLVNCVYVGEAMLGAKLKGNKFHPNGSCMSVM